MQTEEKIEELKVAINAWMKKSYYILHKWEQPTVLSIRTEFNGISAAFKQKCLVCGSERKGKFFYRKEDDFSHASTNISHPKNYWNTQCGKVSAKRMLTRKYPKEFLFKRKEKKRKAEIEYIKIQAERKWNERQEELNFKIILSDSTSKLRKDLAIYRLYRYINCPINEIAIRTNLSKLQIQNIIGEVFSILCLNSRECIFKKYLSFGEK